MRWLILIFCLLCLNLNVFAQIQSNSVPYLISNPDKKIVFDDLVFLNFDPQLYSKKTNNKKAFFGIEMPVNCRISKDKYVEYGGRYIFFKRFIVPKAKGIGIFVECVSNNLIEIFLVSNDRKIYTGGIDNYRNNFSNLLCPVVPTDTLILELHFEHLSDVENFSINKILIGAIEPQSQICEVDINCDTSRLWQTVKRAVAKYIFKGDNSNYWYMCTGELIANTALNKTPYFITANHCISSNEEANTMQIFFNYEKLQCNSPAIAPLQTLNGADLVSKGAPKYDFSLLRLKTIPPKDYKPFYVGWDRTTNYKGSTACIHHPDGDYKKISKCLTQLGIASFEGYEPQTHWHVLQWQTGATEGGSSGSGLYTTQGNLIGVLTGGASSCANPYDDFYQIFAICWNGMPEKDRQLKQWIDSLDINVDRMQGFDPYENDDLPRIENLEFELNKKLVTLKWENLSPLPDKYLVYRNLDLIATVETNTFSEVLTKPNVYAYFVRAVYNQKRSQPSNIVRFLYGDTTKVPNVEQLTIYPQPASSKIRIVTPVNDTISDIQIFDIWGNTVFSKKLQDSKVYNDIDISKWAVGVYFAIVTTPKNRYKQKFVKWIEN